MSQWYYVLNGERKGPITNEQLRSLQLPPETQVCTRELPESDNAVNVAGLIATHSAPTPVPAVPPATMDTNSKVLFLYIPISRLIWMYILSLGVYGAYWIYKNWQYLQRRDGLKILPFWRGIFGIVFIYSLFKAIRNDHEAGAIKTATFSASGLAACWIIIWLFIHARGIYSFANIGTNTFWNVVSLLMIVIFVPVQNYINKVNQAVKPIPAYYNLWSAGHIACMVIGIIQWFCFWHCFF